MQSKLVLTLLLVTCASQALATHTRLDTAGRTYPITEPNVLDELQQKAIGIDLEAMRQGTESYQPANLHPLPRAKSDRVFTVDLAHTLDRDIKDEQGQLLYPQGFTFNPLQYVSLTGGLVVIDGSDPKQIEWFKASSYFQNHRAILLLSGGYASQLKQDLQRPVYYLTHDIAARLELKAVPSVIVEQDHKITVREVYLEEKR